MDESFDYSLRNLDQCSYRYLQQIAKALSLPSNVKKIYLVQLIYTKKYGTPSEVQNIVELVKLERQQNAQGSKKKNRRKKTRLQGTEISSTNNTCQSPPINFTPKRPVVIKYTPNMASHHQPYIKRLRALPQQIKSSSSTGSDRVLRSFNMKTYKKPNYSILNNSIIEVIRAQKEIPKETKISIVSHEGGHPNFNLTARCVLKKYSRPNILNSNSGLKSMNELVPMPRTHDKGTSPPAKRRRLSGIYPITCQAPKNFEYTQSIGFRRNDGKISKINALVQKPPKKYYNLDTPSTAGYRNVEVTVQDIINSNIEGQTFTNPSMSDQDYVDDYPNMSALTDVIPQNITTIPQNITQIPQNSCYREETDAYYQTPSVSMNNVMDTPISEPSNRKTYPEAFSVYYHKKIRAEKVRSNRLSMRDNQVETELPRINDVFDNFSDIVRDYSQPLYVQVSEESQRMPVLESLYTFKSQPLLQIATTANTTTVYSTSVIATPMQQPSCGLGQACVSSTCQRDTYQSVANEEVSKVSMNEYLRLDEQEITLRKYHEAYNTSTSSLETSTSQDLTSVTIPEMVEDALEIISQDGDYMERIGMDERMQCILCSWAGPKFILEYHVRKEHSEQILKQDKNEWNITYKLGSLVNQQLWLSQVTERRGVLYVLSVKYEDPDCFMAALTTLSSDAEPLSGNITIYNKVTGEPYSWHGRIVEIPTNMPYENDTSCLKLQLSSLDLLPNSANLKLLNRELVIYSPSKVVVGQPALNDIHIIMFVKIFD